MSVADWVSIPAYIYLFLLCLKIAAEGSASARSIGLASALFLIPAAVFTQLMGDWSIVGNTPFNDPISWWVVTVNEAGPGPARHLNLITGVMLISGLFILATVMVGLFSYAYDRRGDHFHAIHKVLLKWGIVLFGVFLYLSAQHVNLTPLFVGMGAASIVIGLALQETLSNLFSGIAIDMEGVVARGEWIEIDGTLIGKVMEKGWRSTRIQTIKNEMVVIPNRVMSGERVHNYNRPERTHARILEVGTSYQDPPVKVKQILKAILRDHPLIAKHPEPRVFTVGYFDFAIVYKMMFWIEDYGKHMEIEDAIMTRVWYDFKRDGIEIPFPIRTVHLKDRTERSDEAKVIAVEQDNIARILDNIEILDGITYTDCRFLARNAQRELYPPGEPIIKAGETGEHAYFIIDGGAEVTLPGDIVKPMGLHEYFGEMGLLGSPERTADVTAGGYGCTVIRIDRESMEHVFKTHPELLKRLDTTHQTRRRETGMDIVGQVESSTSLGSKIFKGARKWLRPW